MQDLRFGLRMLRHNRLFALAAVVILALGIGANTTVFTLANAVFLRGLPFERPHEIVAIGMFDSTRGPGRGPFSYPDFLDIRSRARSFRGVGAFAFSPVDLSGPEAAAERVDASSISANTFSLLGQRPRIGRDFTSADEQPGAEPVALLGYGLWQSRYGGDPAVLGRQVRINLRQHTVIGVMPSGEAFPNGSQLWTPLEVSDAAPAARGQRTLRPFARLAPGVGIEGASAEVSTIARALAESFPATNPNMDAMAWPFIQLGAQFTALFTALHGAVGFVLLIACANVANLLLSRAVDRMRESSVRAALGANPWRVARQILVESALLSVLGGLLGLGLAALGVRAFWASVADTNPPYWLHFAMDHRVFAFSVVLCAAAGVIFGLAPALQMARVDVNAHLKEGGRGAGGGVRARRLMAGLLVFEIALAVVLLVGAGLMMRSFVNVHGLEAGLEPTEVLTSRLVLRAERYPEADDRVAFQERLLARLAAVPSRSRFTIASQPPAGGAMFGPFAIEHGETGASGDEPPLIPRVAIAPGYFESLGRSMSEGREFTTFDGRPGAEAAIVNAPFAAQHWPGASAVGRRIRLGGPETAWLTIVGVSPPIFQQGGEETTTVPPGVYVPYRQEPTESLAIVASGLEPSGGLALIVREEVRALDADLPLFDVMTLEERLDRRSWPFRVFGGLFTIFALIALAMASVGIYGVTAYAVGQRTGEIGVRMALGASRESILWLIVRQGLRRIAIGLALGLAGAWGVSRILASLLVGVTPTDPVTFIVTPLVLAAVTLLACVVPAWRAMDLDPIEALRT